jgi:hypothetical protein
MHLSKVLSSLPVRKILDASTPHLNIPGVCQKKKSVLTSFILGNITPEVKKSLHDKLAT